MGNKPSSDEEDQRAVTEKETVGRSSLEVRRTEVKFLGDVNNDNNATENIAKGNDGRGNDADTSRAIDEILVTSRELLTRLEEEQKKQEEQDADVWSESSEDVEQYRNEPEPWWKKQHRNGTVAKILEERVSVYGQLYEGRCKRCNKEAETICPQCIYYFCWNCCCSYCALCITCGCKHIKVFDNGYRYKEKLIRKLGLPFFVSNRGLHK